MDTDPDSDPDSDPAPDPDADPDPAKSCRSDRIRIYNTNDTQFMKHAKGRPFKYFFFSRNYR
jgi:hypothetical protein